MAKGGKLLKLKSALKKWNSFGGKQSRHSINAVADEDATSSSFRSDLHPVFVGKSRRLYRVSSDVVDNPVFRELIERSRETEQENDTVNVDTVNVVACEVVLFDHLLWMLENADPQPESLGELVDFYAC